MKLVSSAFPPGKSPPTQSKVHEQLEKHLKNHPFPEPTIRKFEIADLEQLKQLQQEWFPLNYSSEFYNKVQEGAAHCFVAQVLLTPEPKGRPVRAIVGAIVFQIDQQTQHLVDGWINRLFRINFNSYYIMTLGVIDEMRSKGLALKLLDQIFKSSAVNPKIQLIALHVVAYNKRAINFYKKHGFQLLDQLDDHYHIMGQEYCGLKLGYFVNEGKRRQSWVPWIRRVIFRRNPEELLE